MVPLELSSARRKPPGTGLMDAWRRDTPSSGSTRSHLSSLPTTTLRVVGSGKGSPVFTLSSRAEMATGALCRSASTVTSRGLDDAEEALFMEPVTESDSKVSRQPGKSMCAP